MIERLGKYQIVERIGRGGMGAVYKANDPLLKRVVALKVISENVEENDELRARFFREAKACAQLSHPNIITIYDLGEDAGRLFIVMEHLEGEDLRQVIGQRRELALEGKLALMVQICEALAYAHQKGVVHRDIKPGNVFVSHNGVAKVLDFGLARIASAEEDFTRTGPLIGTLRYIAPEQARGRVDHRSDMFAAASVFYELVAYHPPLPFDDALAILEELRSGTSPSRFRPDPAIPEDLGAVIERALRSDPDQRFRDMTEMRKALDAVRARLSQRAGELRGRLEAQATEARELNARLEEQIGGGVAQDVLPAPGGRAPVAGLEAFCREGEERLVRLRERIEHAGRLRSEYEQAMDQLRVGQWVGAVETFERLVREMPEHVGAQAGLARARAEALQAAEGERARQAAADAQRLMDEQRNRATAASAKEAQQELWVPAEKNRAGGLSALAEQSYGTARERFEAAAAQYRAAADAADRRVQDLLQTARRSLEGRQFSECLALAREVLTLVPTESEAVALSLDAQRGLREEAEQRAAAEERSEDAPAQVGAEGETRPLRLTDTGPEGSNAAALLPRESDPLDDVTVLDLVVPGEVARPSELRAAIKQPGPAKGTGAQPVEPVPPVMEPGTTTQGAPGAGPERPPRLHRRRLVITISGLSAVACALLLWIGVSRHLQTEVDRERRHVSAAREGAVKVEANRLARTLFDAAAGKDRVGEQQAKDGRLSAAAGTMREAAAGYEEAERVSRVTGAERTKADEARTLMLAAKERAPRETTEFKEALAQESEGDSRYGELAFREAAERFGAATRLFASVPPPAPAPPRPIVPVAPERPAAPDATADIKETLRLYSRVFEAKDLGLLQQIRPGIRPEELSRYRNIFDRTRSYKLTLRVDAIRVSGNEAEAKGRREDVVVTSNGETVKTPGEFRFRFKRSNNRWIIDAVR